MDSDADFRRPPTLSETRAPYSDRLTITQWNPYKAEVALMHAAGRTKPEILNRLHIQGFPASPKQLRKRMKEWGYDLSNWGTESISAATEATKLSKARSDITMDVSDASPESMDRQTASEALSFTEGLEVSAWSPYAAHSTPGCDEYASNASTDDIQADEESVISRQTFATHPSDSSSLREYRHECKRLDEIRLLEKQARREAMAATGTLAEPEHRYVYKSQRVRGCKYECHICKHVNSNSECKENRCRRCHHKSCSACLDWPKPCQSPGESESNTFAVNHG
jgi:hypothetical protein